MPEKMFIKSKKTVTRSAVLRKGHNDSSSWFACVHQTHKRLFKGICLSFCNILFGSEGKKGAGKPRRVGGGGEEEECPGGDDDQHGWDVVQEDVPFPPGDASAQVSASHKKMKHLCGGTSAGHQQNHFQTAHLQQQCYEQPNIE